MAILSTVVRALKANAGVNTASGGRVFADFIPEKSTLPAVVVYTTYEDAEDCLDGFTDFAEASIRIECYGKTRESSDALHDAVKAALDGYRGKISGDTIWVKGVRQGTGRIHLVDMPQDATDHWQFRTAQTFDFNYLTL